MKVTESKLLSKTMKDYLLSFLEINRLSEKDVKSVDINGLRDIIIIKTSHNTFRIDYETLKYFGEVSLYD